MKIFLFTISIILTCTNSIFSQVSINGKVINKENNKPVDLVTISIKHKSIGTYSNQDGEFTIDKVNIKDTLVIRHLSYKDRNIAISDIPSNGVILLQTNTNVIRSICVNAYKHKEYEIGFSKKRSHSNFGMNSLGNKIITLISNSNYKDYFIKEIVVCVKKESNSHYYLRTHLYENNNNKPGKEIFCKNNIHEINKSERKLYLNISEEYIRFPKEGIFVGIELLGQTLDRKNNKINNEIIKPWIKTSSIKSHSFIEMWHNRWFELSSRDLFKHMKKNNSAKEYYETPLIGLKLEK